MPGDVQLHLFWGLPGSGKSTLVRDLAAEPATVLIAEDEWLSALYGDQMASLADYIACSATLKTQMAPHVVGLLAAGVRVVLDFPANTPEQRAWLLWIIHGSGARHVLHRMDVEPALCWERVQARQAAGKGVFSLSRAQFDRVAAVVSAPLQSDGFAMQTHAERAQTQSRLNHARPLATPFTTC
jgi:predicted kinase